MVRSIDFQENDARDVLSNEIPTRKLKWDFFHILGGLLERSCIREGKRVDGRCENPLLLKRGKGSRGRAAKQQKEQSAMLIIITKIRMTFVIL